MNKNYTYGAAMLLGVLLMVAALMTAPIQQGEASPPAAQPTLVPTTVPYDIQSPGANAVDIYNGGVFRSGIAVEGDTDEQQLMVIANSTQTADEFVVQSSSGTEHLVVDGNGDTALGKSVALVPAASQTLIEGFTLTPTGTFQEITAASAITSSATTAVTDGGVDGELLVIWNSGSYDIIIQDGANTKFSGDLTLASNDDVMLLIWDATDSNWLAIANSDN